MSSSCPSVAVVAVELVAPMLSAVVVVPVGLFRAPSSSLLD
jgi:hypothetical protein